MKRINITHLNRTAGFTRLELTAVLATLAVLALLMLPTVAREQSDATRAFCLYRMGQMGKALAMYTEDYRGWLPPNPDDGNTTPYRNWVGGNMGSTADATNSSLLMDPARSLLSPYLQGNSHLYRCPSDPSLVTAGGKQFPRVRNISLSQAVGTNPYKNGGKAPVDGPWLDGYHGHIANSKWHCFGNNSDFVRPGPANTFTFLEEDPDSINDGGIATVGPMSPSIYRMIDWPATLHDMSAVVTFADAHVELHRWVDLRTKVQNHNIAQAIQEKSKDLIWLAEHTTALIKQ